MPRTPDIHRQYSKRAWDGIVRKWRRELHSWDVVSADGKPIGVVPEHENSNNFTESTSSSFNQPQKLTTTEDNEIDEAVANLPDADVDAEDLEDIDAQLAALE